MWFCRRNKASLKVMGRALIRIFAIASIIAMLSHEPSFQMFLEAMIRVHIFARILFGSLHRQFVIQCPQLLAHFTNFTKVRSVLSSYLDSALKFTQPVMQAAMGHLLRFSLWWVHKSPGILCVVNLKIVEMAAFATNLLEMSLEDDTWVKLMDMEAELSMLCALVRC